ncbi:hypothetical protein DRP04_01100 [Archaeoglobales archaeon]|nr:MAG: hypothetical protein DRP04_01100 [Archaeoglobales archaeon]
MHKDEVILVHLALFYVKQFLEAAGVKRFQAYGELGILPAHVHRSKAHHEKAAMLLCVEILRVLGELEGISRELRDVLKKKEFLMETSGALVT